MTKWDTCLVQLENARQAFQELDEGLEQAQKTKWAEEEQAALLKGGEALSVYGVRLKEGSLLFFSCPVPSELDQYLSFSTISGGNQIEAGAE